MAKNRHMGYDGVDRNESFFKELYKATVFGDLSFYSNVNEFTNPKRNKIHFDKRKNEFR